MVTTHLRSLYFKFHIKFHRTGKISSFSHLNHSCFLEHYCFFLQPKHSLLVAPHHIKGELGWKKCCLCLLQCLSGPPPGLEISSLLITVTLGEFSGSRLTMLPEADIFHQFWKAPCCCFLNLTVPSSLLLLLLKTITDHLDFSTLNAMSLYHQLVFLCCILD